MKNYPKSLEAQADPESSSLVEAKEEFENEDEKSQELGEAIETAILVAFIRAKRKGNEKYEQHISTD